ncbi:hypothetical protein GQ457_02G040370 [Hibiscus cannabinus]
MLKLKPSIDLVPVRKVCREKETWRSFNAGSVMNIHLCSTKTSAVQASGGCVEEVLGGPSYSCGECGFIIHVKCSINIGSVYGMVEVENPDEFEEFDQLYELMSCIIRVIKEIKVGDDVIAAEIVHVSHEHNLIFSDEIQDNEYCNGCLLPILFSFYYCSHYDFFLYKECAELPRVRRLLPRRCWLEVGLQILEPSIDLDQKRNMAKLHHMSHKHPLLFNDDSSDRNDHNSDCAGCAKEVSSPSYSCGECRFFLHKRCAEAPSEIHHPAHRDHSLLLLPPSEHRKREVDCSLCKQKVKGHIYCCSSCEFHLDFDCALLPHYTSAGDFIETRHAAHQHPLVSISPTRSFECVGCFGRLVDSSYACFDCRMFVHEKCLELSTKIDHSCHRKHQLELDLDADSSACNLCQSIRKGFFYRCVPCGFNIHTGCARPPPIIEDTHHEHPFSLLLKPNDPFNCDACGNQGNHVSYICSECNIQVHKDCISLPRHIRLSLHPHPISHHFFLRIDHDDSRTLDCRICYKKVNTEHGSFYCSRPGCDFVVHAKCVCDKWTLYGAVEVENPNEFESDPLYEPMSCIVRKIKEIEVDGNVIVAEMEHVSHEHDLILSDEIKDDTYCNGCILPIQSSFYYCARCDFILDKACAELPKMRRSWHYAKPFRIITDGVFRCDHCHYECSGFSYKSDDDIDRMCLRCAKIPHGFEYQADKPYFLFYDDKYEGKCNACCEDSRQDKGMFQCKDNTFALHRRCLMLPRTTRHKCDRHSLTLTYQDPDNYPLRHYCDICETERDPQQWFYHCETCDKAMHFECVIGEHKFIMAGSKYTDKNHPHPLTFVKKIYLYPRCVLCDKPCRDLALECRDNGCKYIVHWSCIKPL